jgi:hypothetical protein
MGSHCWQSLQAKRKHLLTFLREGFDCVTERPSVSRQRTYVSGTLSLDLTPITVGRKHLLLQEKLRDPRVHLN